MPVMPVMPAMALATTMMMMMMAIAKTFNCCFCQMNGKRPAATTATAEQQQQQQPRHTTQIAVCSLRQWVRVRARILLDQAESGVRPLETSGSQSHNVIYICLLSRSPAHLCCTAKPGRPLLLLLPRLLWVTKQPCQSTCGYVASVDESTSKVEHSIARAGSIFFPLIKINQVATLATLLITRS